MAKAIIYLRESSGHLEGEWIRSIMTFNFGNYKAENRGPFGTLQVFNEETLAAGKSLQLLVAENTEVLIIPLVGTIAFRDAAANETYIKPGQLQLFSAAAQSSYAITNPFEEEVLVNFLQIWLYKNEAPFIPAVKTFSFNLAISNQLHKVLAPENLHQQAYCYIGKYDGRKKGIYNLQNANHGVYVFVADGAFEVEDRLLHAKDGLAVWDTAVIDFEALSNDAILLLFEVPL